MPCHAKCNEMKWNENNLFFTMPLLTQCTSFCTMDSIVFNNSMLCVCVAAYQLFHVHIWLVYILMLLNSWQISLHCAFGSLFLVCLVHTTKCVCVFCFVLIFIRCGLFVVGRFFFSRSVCFMCHTYFRCDLAYTIHNLPFVLIMEGRAASEMEF